MTEAELKEYLRTHYPFENELTFRTTDSDRCLFNHER